VVQAQLRKKNAFDRRPLFPGKRQKPCTHNMEGFAKANKSVHKRLKKVVVYFDKNHRSVFFGEWFSIWWNQCAAFQRKVESKHTLAKNEKQPESE
jgi:hypothetical protein